MTFEELKVIKDALAYPSDKDCECNFCKAIRIIDREIKLKEIENDPTGKNLGPVKNANI